MIKFFRHIRQSLIEQNKMGKYFKYAIGEILLVVIGILIALQINNWNEASKLKSIELDLLGDFKEGLEFDLSQIDSMDVQYDRAKSSILHVLNHLENNLPYSNHLDSIFFETTLIFDSGGLTDGAYETLNSSGLNLISNKDILNQIIIVYEEHNTWLVSWEERYTNLLFEAQKDIYRPRFNDFWGGDYRNKNIVGTMTPRSYEALKNDEEFKHHLRTQLNLIGWLINKPADATRIEAEKLLHLINEELDTKQPK